MQSAGARASLHLMSVNITIRNVPDGVRDELAGRAARQGRSLQEYLSRELARLAERPDAEAWLEGVRRRKAAAGSRLSADEILAFRDADRR
jgi:antitoxin FitA